MGDIDKTKEELIKEILTLRKEYNSLKAILEKDITRSRHQEQAAEKRIIVLEQPLDNTQSVEIEDLLRIADLQILQDAFSNVLGVASIITRSDGTPITSPSNFTDFCTNIIRKTSKGCENCYKSDAAIGKLNPGGPTIQHCLSGGLWDAGVGFQVGGRHIANWLIGQIRDETQTEESIRAYAEDIGADPDAAISAFLNVPSMTKEKFDLVAELLFKFADQLSSLAYQNLQHARFISASKLAEEALRQSEDRFRALFEKGPIGVAYHKMIYDDSGKAIDYLFLDANSSYRELTGIDPRGKLVTQAFPGIENDPFDWIGTFGAVARTGQQVRFEQYLESNDRWYDCVGYQFKPDHFVSAFVEITQRKLSEQAFILANKALLKSEENFHRSISESPLGIRIVSVTGETIYANKTLLDIYGFNSLEEFKRVPAINLYTPESYAQREERKENRKKGTDVLEYEISIVRKNMEIRHIHVLRKEVLWNGTRHYQVINTDITDRKESEKALKKLQTAIESSKACIVITDADGNIEYANPYFTESIGYTPEEYLGKNPRILKTDFNDLTYYQNLWNTIKSGQTWEGEFCNRKKNAEIYWENAIISPIKLSNNEITHFVAVKTDITATKKISEELTKAKERAEERENQIQKLYYDLQALEEETAATNEELKATTDSLMQSNEELELAKKKAEESDRLKSAFLANMSHEIRTPMNGILGFAELLKDPGLSGEEQQEYIRIIEKGGARMLNIINNIVSISKIESGTMAVSNKESNVNEQIEYIYNFFKPEVEAKGLKHSVKNSLSVKEAIIKTDNEKLYAILTNLVKNAIKYTDKGTIEFGYEKKGVFLEFFVEDSGIGIPKNRQKAIFERFIQADIEDKMARQGAGLGLSISKAYVEMLGGKIWVESEVSEGSTFYFTLPYNEVSKEINPIKNAFPEKDTEILIKKLNILIAEDDEASEVLLDIKVKLFGKEILKARNGLEAVEICRNNPDLDLILMDIQMPVMNGYEATRQIRQFNKEVVIIAQTAFSLIGDKEKAIEAGCNDYISKPINNNLLKGLIGKYFGN